MSDRKRSRQSSAILRKRVQSSIKFSKQIFVSLCRSGLLTSRVTGPLRTDPTRPGIWDPRPKTRVKGCRRRHHMMAENLFGELFCKLRTHCEKKCCQSKLLTFLSHTPRLFLHLPTDGVARIFYAFFLPPYAAACFEPTVELNQGSGPFDGCSTD